MAQVLDKDTWQQDAKALGEAGWSDEKIMTYFEASGNRYLVEENAFNNLLKEKTPETLAVDRPGRFTLPVGGQIAAPELTNPYPFPPPIREAVESGMAQKELFTLEFAENMYGVDPARTARMEELEPLIHIDTEGESLLSQIATKSIEVSPMMAGAMTRGAAYGTIAGGAALATGPAAPVAVPAAATFGFAAGVAMQSYVYETGAAYHELKQYDIDPEIARYLSRGVGFVNAIIEVSQIGMLLDVVPGGGRLKSILTKKAIDKVITSKPIMKILAKRVGKAGLIYSAEVGQEVLQEINNTVAVHIADAIDETVEIPDEMRPRMKDTVYFTARDAALSFIPMVGVSQVIAGGVDLSQNAQVKAFEDHVNEVQEHNRKVMSEVVRIMKEQAVESVVEGVLIEDVPEYLSLKRRETEDTLNEEGKKRLKELKKPTTVEQAVAEGIKAQQETTIRKFDVKIEEGDIKAAQVIYYETIDAVNQDPNNTVLLEEEKYMKAHFDELDKAKEVEAAEEIGIPFEQQQLPLGEVVPPPPVQKVASKVTVQAKEKLATDKQVAKVHGMAGELGITPEELDARSQRQYGAPLSQLKGTQIGGLIGEFRRRIEKRPEILNDTRVITIRTEKELRGLKNRVLSEGIVTPTQWVSILKSVGLKPDNELSYISDKQFITEETAEKVMRAVQQQLIVHDIVDAPAQKTQDSFYGDYYSHVKNTIDAIDNSGKDPSPLWSMRYYMEGLTQETHKPFAHVFDSITTTTRKLATIQASRYQRLVNAVGDRGAFDAIIKGKDSQLKISQWIASHTNLEGKPDRPNLTPDELAFAMEFQQIMKSMEYLARLRKFNRWYFMGIKPGEFKDHESVRDAMYEAREVFNTQGQQALVEKLKTQTWGTISGDGYEPMEILKAVFHDYPRANKKVSVKHIKARGTVYHKQERTLMQRFNSYARQMDAGVWLEPKLDLLSKFAKEATEEETLGNADKVQGVINTFTDNILGYNVIDSFWGEWVSRSYNQALTALLKANPYPAIRNTFQSTSFYPNKADFFDPRNRILTDAEAEHIRTEVSQMRPMDEYFSTDFGIPIFKPLNYIANKINLYPWSDEVGRWQTYWAMLNRTERARFAMEKMINEGVDKDTAFQLFREKAWLTIMTPHQEVRLMEIWANDGPEAMQMYRSKIMTEDTHFKYELAERSPTEQTPFGRMATKLFLFPRAYAERLYRYTRGMYKGKNKLDNTKAMFSWLAGGMFMGSVLMKIFGKRQNPYDPLNVMQWQPFALLYDAATLPFRTMGDVVEIASPFTPDDMKRMAWNRLANDVSKMTSTYIPFWIFFLGSLEATTDKKYLDKYAIRRMRMMFDEEYQVREDFYDVERTGHEAFKRSLGGRGGDRIKQEEEKKKPKRAYRGRRGSR